MLSTMSEEKVEKSRRPNGWTFLSNHSHVLFCLAADPDARLRDVAELVGITERAVQGIVADLEHAGILVRTRDGRRNHYVIFKDKHLRHPVEAASTVGDLLKLASRRHARPANKGE